LLGLSLFLKLFVGITLNFSVMNGTVNPGPDQLQAVMNESQIGGQVVMVNLLRFREEADYSGTGIEGEKISGHKAYQKYSKAVIKTLWRTGGQVLWTGKVRLNFILPAGEQWDEVLLIWYPSRKAFIKMITSEEYAQIVGHRTAALADSRLLETQAVKLPKVMLGMMRFITRLKFGKLK